MAIESRNETVLEGRLMTDPVWSHANHGTNFYRIPLEVLRLSGQADILPLLVPESLLPQAVADSVVRVQGQFRSFNNRQPGAGAAGNGNRLILTVYVQKIQPATGTPCNQITLAGVLCKAPVFRRTPLGRSICDLMLAAPRRYGRADYLPVIAWGQLAVTSGQLKVGDSILMEGRIQSRVYHKTTEAGVEERTAYEISMMHLLEQRGSNTETKDAESTQDAPAEAAQESISVPAQVAETSISTGETAAQTNTVQNNIAAEHPVNGNPVDENSVGSSEVGEATENIPAPAAGEPDTAGPDAEVQTVSADETAKTVPASDAL